METVDIFKDLKTQECIGTLTLNVDRGTHLVTLTESGLSTFEIVSESCPFSNHDFLAYCPNNQVIGYGQLNPSKAEMVLEIELFEKNEKFYAVLPNNQFKIAA